MSGFSEVVDEAEFDREVRVSIARAIRERGVIPSIAEVALDLGRGPSAVDASFARMIDQHVFIPRKGSHEVYAYDPFCADPTELRVQAAGREWWAICGWDALGILPALGTDGEVSARCGDCGEPIDINVTADGHATARFGAVLQIGVPAREFWKDIYFT